MMMMTKALEFEVLSNSTNPFFKQYFPKRWASQLAETATSPSVAVLAHTPYKPNKSILIGHGTRGSLVLEFGRRREDAPIDPMLIIEGGSSYLITVTVFSEFERHIHYLRTLNYPAILEKGETLLALSTNGTGMRIDISSHNGRPFSVATPYTDWLRSVYPNLLSKVSNANVSRQALGSLMGTVSTGTAKYLRSGKDWLLVN